MGRDDASQHGANEGHSCRPRSSPGGDRSVNPNMHCYHTVRATDKRGAEQQRRGWVGDGSGWNIYILYSYIFQPLEIYMERREG